MGALLLDPSPPGEYPPPPPSTPAPTSGSKEWEQQHESRRVQAGNFEEIDKKLGGRFGRGNINLNGRQVYLWENGKNYSSLESITIEHDGRHVLIPKVNDKGDLLSADQAVEMYQKTGKYLGKFGTDNEATDYAISLERRQQSYYENGPGKTILERAKNRRPSSPPSQKNYYEAE